MLHGTDGTGGPTSPLRVLCIEDSPDDADLIRRSLGGLAQGLDWAIAHDEASVRQALQRAPDLVLCDYHLPRFGPVRALAVLDELAPGVPLVVVTRSIGEEAAVALLRAGAADYVTKDRLATLPLVIERVLEAARQRQRQRRLTLDLQSANARLRDLSSRLVRAQEDERAVIARELHDSLGQSLTAALVHTHAAESAPDPQVSAIYRQTSRRVLEQAIQQVKTLSFAMRPPQLDLLGLPATLEMLADQVLRPSGIAVELRCLGVPDEGAGVGGIIAFRIAQEALNNVARHASARRVRMQLRFRGGGGVRLTIADDGRGFDPGAVLQRAPGRLQRGLLGMLERCELAGGQMQLRSRPGQGTVIRAEF